MTWFEIGQEIIDPATSEKWIVVNVGRHFGENTFLHLNHTTKTQPGVKVRHPVQRGCLVNRKTGEHTKSPW